MLESMTAVACVLYLAPLLAVVALLRNDDALDVACAIPLVVSLDLLGTFVFSYVVRVDYLAFVRTAVISVAVLAVCMVRFRARRPICSRGARLSRGDLGAAVVGAAIAVLLSWAVSGHAWASDREWHTPFTAALRAQTMPFRNVYEPALTIRYHLAGDLSAAVLQALSFATMNGSRAISIAHDIQSGLLVGTIALLFRSTCPWSPAVAGLAALVPFLAGPIGIRAGGMGMFEGYADFSNFVLSFRPHAMLSLLLLTGIACRVLGAARALDRHASSADDSARADPAPSARSTVRTRTPWAVWAGLVPLFALTGITDEISTAACGVALGLVWLVWPRLFGDRRWRGAVVLSVLALVVLAANRLLAGTIAPGGPVERTNWVAPRIPHFFGKPTPVTWAAEGWVQLFIDEGALIASAIIISWQLWRDRESRDALAVVSCFAFVTLGIGLVEFLCFEVNGRTYEGHRFMTAGRMLVPLVALAWLPRWPRASLKGAIILGGLYAGGVTTLGFTFSRFMHPDPRGTAAYQANCRADFGAKIGEPIAPTYVDEPIWHAYAGCRPIFAAGHDGPPGVVLAGWAKLGPEGFAKMEREIYKPGQPARVVCPADDFARTEFCRRAAAIGPCRPEGSRVVACEIPPSAWGALEHP